MNIFRPFASIEISITGSEHRVNRALAPLFQDSLCAESTRLSISHRGGDDASCSLIIRQVRAKARPGIAFEGAKMAARALSLILNRSVISLIHEGDAFTICCDADALALYRSVDTTLRIIGEADREIQVGRIGWTVGQLKTAAL